VSLQTTGSRALLVLMFVILFGSYGLTYFESSGPAPVITEHIECVEAICKELPGAGPVCALQKPLVTKITVTSNGGVKTWQFTPTTDRCTYGDD